MLLRQASAPKWRGSEMTRVRPITRRSSLEPMPLPCNVWLFPLCTYWRLSSVLATIPCPPAHHLQNCLAALMFKSCGTFHWLRFADALSWVASLTANHCILRPGKCRTLPNATSRHICLCNNHNTKFSPSPTVSLRYITYLPDLCALPLSA